MKNIKGRKKVRKKGRKKGSKGLEGSEESLNPT
jgi:hypothetical protein